MNLMHLSYTCAICRCEWGQGVCLVDQTLIIDYCLLKMLLALAQETNSTRSACCTQQVGFLQPPANLLHRSLGMFTHAHTHTPLLHVSPHTTSPLWASACIVMFSKANSIYLLWSVYGQIQMTLFIYSVSFENTPISLGAFFFLSFLKEYVSVYSSIYCMCGTSVVVLCFRISDTTQFRGRDEQHFASQGMERMDGVSALRAF